MTEQISHRRMVEAIQVLQAKWGNDIFLIPTAIFDDMVLEVAKTISSTKIPE